MLFVRQAGTPGTRSACFPMDENADPSSLARAAALARARSWTGPALVAPARAAGQTAAAMGLRPSVVQALAEADHGGWSGLPYAKVAETEPDALASWLADPHAAPHGGESLAALAARVAAWLDAERRSPTIVICDVGVIRAVLGHALGLNPLAATRFDLAPLSTTELSSTRGGWRVAHVNRKATL
ncbi:histidine phosphatase family protein [Nonomuraea sp. NEAU-A123]|uniref:histidine phosphatase family protein n=1 Tax=Nonomuraea sp. NEAU-A123 TaxID=2839649 RepID=UPI001BE459F4|nr:histidine phosphatase family protein [Nonomuraea sp. NEAU-A123]MBT2231411.1 histidine phosphatase family protein [Nonomuraea sp. NEAU-A123]